MNLHKATKSIVSLGLCLSLVVCVSSLPKANADTLSDLRSKYSELQKQQQQAQAKLNDLKGKVNTEQQKKDAIDSNINAINSQITVLNNEIDSLENDIESANASIKKTEESIKTTEEQYKKRVCALYEAGNTSKIQILLSANNFSDFFNKFETIQVISEHDTKLADDLKTEKSTLEATKKQLDEKKEAVETSKGSLAAKKEVVRVQLAEQQKILNGIKDDEDEAESERNDIKKQAAQTDAQINAEIKRQAEERRKKMQKNRTTVSNSYIVNYARGFLGTQYRSGRADPSVGFDCSGFVQYVFANAAGIGLDHSAASIACCGTSVSRENLSAGDVVYFGNHGRVDHVGIYTGNGNFIAANTGHQWCVAEGSLFGDSYFGPHYMGARRIN